MGEKLRIVTEPWSPYVTVDDQQASGLDYEMTNIVFKRLGIDVQWQFLPWKRCLMMLEQGEADGVLDIFKVAEREDLLLYPNEPLSDVNWVLFQSNDRPHPFNALDDLHGLTIGVSPGYLYTPEFDTSSLFIREPAPSHEANFGKLVRGRIDLLVTDRLVGQETIHQLKLRDKVSQLPLVLGRRPHVPCASAQRGHGFAGAALRCRTQALQAGTGLCAAGGALHRRGTADAPGVFRRSIGDWRRKNR